jgi:nicotinate-nucleotide pyrophosphorylase
MLDNFTGEGLKQAAKNIKERWAAKGKNGFLVESSGGITYETCAKEELKIYSRFGLLYREDVNIQIIYCLGHLIKWLVVVVLNQ